LYHKTRNPASTASAKRAKKIDFEHVHVVLRDLVDESEERRQEFIASLKNFRPQQTIFEQQESPQNAILAMETKRRAHLDIIEKTKLKNKEKNQKNQTTNVLVDSDDDFQGNKNSHFSLMEDKVYSFRDDLFYLNSTPKNHYTEKGLEIEKNSNANIEEMVLDLIPDDSKSIFRKRTINVWDNKRRDYVQVSPGKNMKSKKTRVKTESGKMATASEKGKLYEAWTKKTKREIGKAGEQEGDTSLSLYQTDKERSRFRHHKNKKEEEKTRNELKSTDQIRKARKIKQKQKDRLKRKRSSTGGPRKKRKI